MHVTAHLRSWPCTVGSGENVDDLKKKETVTDNQATTDREIQTDIDMLMK